MFFILNIDLKSKKESKKKKEKKENGFDVNAKHKIFKDLFGRVVFFCKLFCLVLLSKLSA